MQLKSVMRNINLCNIFLLGIALLFGMRMFMPALYPDFRYSLPPAKIGADEEKNVLLQQQTPSLSEYMVISEDNPFHPERKIPVEKKPELDLPKPEFVLYGTLVTDDLKLAYLEDLKAPRSTSGRGKRQIALKKGDSLSGFTLKEIETGKIVMTRGNDSITVPIIDPAHPREAQTTVAQTEPKQPQKPVAKPTGSQRDRRLGSTQPPAASSPRMFIPKR